MFSCFLVFFQTGTCALFFAAQGGYIDIVKELLDRGAAVDLASQVGPNLFFTLLLHSSLPPYTLSHLNNDVTSAHSTE